MAEPVDMIGPMLRELRVELLARFDRVDAQLAAADHRFDSLEKGQATFKHAMTADSLLSRLLTGEWEERIEALEQTVRRLEASK